MLAKKRKTLQHGGSIVAPIPQAHRDLLGIEKGDTLDLEVIQASALHIIKDGKFTPLLPRASLDEWVQIVRRD